MELNKKNQNLSHCIINEYKSMCVYNKTTDKSFRIKKISTYSKTSLIWTNWGSRLSRLNKITKNRKL